MIRYSEDYHEAADDPVVVVLKIFMRHSYRRMFNVILFSHNTFLIPLTRIWNKKRYNDYEDRSWFIKLS